MWISHHRWIRNVISKRCLRFRLGILFKRTTLDILHFSLLWKRQKPQWAQFTHRAMSYSKHVSKPHQATCTFIMGNIAVLVLWFNLLSGIHPAPVNCHLCSSAALKSKQDPSVFAFIKIENIFMTWFTSWLETNWPPLTIQVSTAMLEIWIRCWLLVFSWVIGSDQI